MHLHPLRFDATIPYPQLLLKNSIFNSILLHKEHIKVYFTLKLTGGRYYSRAAFIGAGTMAEGMVKNALNQKTDTALKNQLFEIYNFANLGPG